MIKTIILIIVAEIWNTLGQVLYKKGANDFSHKPLKNIRNVLDFCASILKSRLIVLGFISMVISLFVWVLALANADLSFVFPMGSINYIFILLATRIFLNEKLDRMKLIGTSIIIVGLFLIGRG